MGCGGGTRRGVEGRERGDAGRTVRPPSRSLVPGGPTFLPLLKVLYHVPGFSLFQAARRTWGGDGTEERQNLEPPTPWGKASPETPHSTFAAGGEDFWTPILPSRTHGLEFLLGEEAGLAAGCEVAKNPEGVAGAALVGVDPVLTWGGRTEGWGRSSTPLFCPPPALPSPHRPAGGGGRAAAPCRRARGSRGCPGVSAAARPRYAGS